MITVTRDQVTADVANVVNRWFPKSNAGCSSLDVFKLRGALIALLTNVANMIEYSAMLDLLRARPFDEDGRTQAPRQADAWPELNPPALENETEKR